MIPWLLVEDEVDIRNIVKVMFQVWGHSIIEFSNGTDAFKFLDAVQAGTYSGDLPAFALMDIRMPGPNGNETARKIRQTEPIKNIPVILMTAFQLTENEQQDYKTNFGVDKIIFKPLPDFDVLHQIIHETIALKEKESAAPKAEAPATKPVEAKATEIKSVESKPATSKPDKTEKSSS